MLSARPLPRSRPVTASASILPILADYLALTKPGIVACLLLTSLGSMVVAAQGLPSLSLLFLVMAGGALGAAGANVLNHYVDRDIDQQMIRTCRRPVAGRRIAPRAALVFGIVLNLLAFLILAARVNLLSALLTLSATLFYVLVYTCWLKRSTPQNIVIGGAAGAVPPLVGWAGVTGGLDLPAWYLFALIFLWTPPHFWALAILVRQDYARARVPMLPVVGGVAKTARYIMLYTVALVAVTVLFFTTGAVGWLYLCAAIGMGALFLLMAFRLLRTGGVEAAGPLYRYSKLYLAVIFATLVVGGVLSI